MAAIILIIVFWAWFKWNDANLNHKVDNYNMRNVDSTKLTADMHLSARQKQQNLV